MMFGYGWVISVPDWGSKAGGSKGRSGVRDRDHLGAICMQNIETVLGGYGNKDPQFG